MKHMSSVQRDFSQAMGSLCPSLGTALGADQFAEINKLLETEAQNSFSSWVGQQMSNFASSLALVTCTAPLTVLPAWDKVTIEETGDSGQQVIWEELSPRNPSMCLISYSFSTHSLLTHSFIKATNN